MAEPSAIRNALYNNRPEDAQRLVASGAVPDFYDACAMGDWDIADHFLTTDPRIAATFAEDGFSALGLAIFFRNRDIAIRLLVLGAPVNEASRNPIRVTPLHSASAKNDFVMCAVLLSHGADPNAKEFLGGTPLHTAAAEGDLNLVRMLARHGARLGEKTNAGETPLDLARKYKREETAAWLVSNGR